MFCTFHESARCPHFLSFFFNFLPFRFARKNNNKQLAGFPRYFILANDVIRATKLQNNSLNSIVRKFKKYHEGDFKFHEVQIPFSF